MDVRARGQPAPVDVRHIGVVQFTSPTIDISPLHPRVATPAAVAV